MPDISAETEDTLRGLASGRRSVVEGLLRLHVDGLEESGLDPRAHGLVTIAALVGSDAPAPAYRDAVDTALAAGVTPDEAVGVLIAVAPLVGTARIVTAAPAVMDALGLAPAPEPPRRGAP